MVRPWTAKPAKAAEVRMPRPPRPARSRKAQLQGGVQRLAAAFVTVRPVALPCPPPPPGSRPAAPALAQALPPEGDEPACRVPALMELCMEMIANNLHTIPSIEYLPSHLMKDILDRRKNECMTDADLGFFLAATFEAVPPEQLDYLSMRSCRNLTDEGFAFVFRSCQWLQTLDLAFSELVGDKAMQALSENCSSLTSLNLTGCRQVSDAGCAHIGRLKALSAVELELCNKITDIGIQSIVRSCNSNLQVLNLGDVRNMSNVSIQIIADHCPSLRSLSIAGNMQAMDLDVADVCKRATVLPAPSARARVRELTGSRIRHYIMRIVSAALPRVP